eukprot:Partr_v1_DN24051_c1_g1_i2_m34736
MEESSPPLSGDRLDYVLAQLEIVKSKVRNKKAGENALVSWNDFWIRPKLPLLSRNIPTPGQYPMPRIFLWLPRLLDVDIVCPHCGSCKTIVKGWPDKPVARRVVDLHDCYYLVARRQECKNDGCRKMFSSSHPRVVAALPHHVRELFPAVLTARSGLDKQVVQILRTSVSESFGLDAFRKMLKENHYRRYDSLKLQYYSIKKWASEKGAAEREKATNNTINVFAVATRLEEFPAFDDPDGYGGFHPSSKYLTEVYISFILSNESSLAAQ